MKWTTHQTQCDESKVKSQTWLWHVEQRDIEEVDLSQEKMIVDHSLLPLQWPLFLVDFSVLTSTNWNDILTSL